MPPSAIYLDHNATAPILPEVAEAVRDAALRYAGNPASQHEVGRAARRALEAARHRIGEFLGAQMSGMHADQIVFTSGGTESNNLALNGLLHVQPRALPGGSSERREPAALSKNDPRPEAGATGRRLVISALEHPSVMRSAERLAARGVQVETIAVNREGTLRIERLEQRLATPTQLVSVMLASNETGVLQPVAEIAAICRASGVLMHTDATQAVGKIPVSFQELGVDALTAAAHKFHGPLGIGVLIVRHGVKLEPSLHGGFQQAALRPGTESVALAIGMQTALELWHREADQRRDRMAALRDELERGVRAGYPQAIIIGGDAPRLPNTSNLAFVGLDRQALVMGFDLAGVACSTGSACASGSSEPSPALVAMGLPEEQISSSIRLSLGAMTTAEEVAEAGRRILAVCNRLSREK
jgi:cysteine desulfurase